PDAAPTPNDPPAANAAAPDEPGVTSRSAPEPSTAPAPAPAVPSAAAASPDRIPAPTPDGSRTSTDASHQSAVSPSNGDAPAPSARVTEDDERSSYLPGYEDEPLTTFDGRERDAQKAPASVVIISGSALERR